MQNRGESPDVLLHAPLVPAERLWRGVGDARDLVGLCKNTRFGMKSDSNASKQKRDAR
jgi:hypothetical protein